MMKMAGVICILVFTLIGCTRGDYSNRYSGFNMLRIKKENSVVTKSVKTFVRIPLALLTLGSSEVVYSYHRNMERFVGQSEATLLAEWGEPTNRIRDITNGDWVLCYNWSGTSKTPAMVSATNFLSVASNAAASAFTFIYIPSSEVEVHKVRSFRVNQSGYVTFYYWRSTSEGGF